MVEVGRAPSRGGETGSHLYGIWSELPYVSSYNIPSRDPIAVSAPRWVKWVGTRSEAGLPATNCMGGGLDEVG